MHCSNCTWLTEVDRQQVYVRAYKKKTQCSVLKIGYSFTVQTAKPTLLKRALRLSWLDHIHLETESESDIEMVPAWSIPRFLPLNGFMFLLKLNTILTYVPWRCIFFVTACSSSPCLHDGTCILDSSYTYHCACLAGYTGKRCENGKSLNTSQKWTKPTNICF